MEAELRKVLKKLVLEIRHLLDGYYDERDVWHAGDLEQRLNQIGVWRNRPARPLEELPQLSEVDNIARRTVDAYIKYSEETGVNRAEAVGEFIRESAYTWFNQLFALRCMEARGIIDEIILKKDIYGGRSLRHNRLAISHPELCSGEDDGLYAVLFQEFERRAHEIPLLFNPESPIIALRPSVSVSKRLVSILSGLEPANGIYASDEIFTAPDAFGWAYQYWNTEEKDRIFERTRTEKAKIEGKDIIPATCLYTEPYMVKFLVQNSLGAQWSYMHPESRLFKGWDYYVRDADRSPVESKFVREITFMDPACGSGHFLLEAFGLYYDMYREERELTTSEEICASILNNNLYGIDIDERAVQISIAVLWMKAKEKAPHLDSSRLDGFYEHLVATNIRLPKGRDHLKEFLGKHPEDRILGPTLESIFEALENVNEIGSLLWIEAPLEIAFESLRTEHGIQTTLWSNGFTDIDSWRKNVIEQLNEHFTEEAVSTNLSQAFFGHSMNKGLRLLDLLSDRYDIVATNPPYMGAGNMGPIVKKYTELHYHSGKRDLYTAFILRCLQLTSQHGRIAMVTRQSWMFLRYFKNLRLVKSSADKKEGLLVDASFEIISQLGAGAFEEISGEVVSVVLFVVVRKTPTVKQRIHASRLVSFPDAAEKELALRLMASLDPRVPVYRPQQLRFIYIPESPFLFWLTEGLWTLFEESERLEKYAEALEGVQTGENLRWVRYFWEVRGVDENREWVCFLKGGGYQKWAGLDDSVVRWGENGKLLASVPGSTLRNRHKYFQPGLSYTDFASGCLGVRFLQGNEVFDLGAPCVFPIEAMKWSIFGLSCVLNSRIASYLIRLLSPNPQHIRTGYLRLLPLPFQPPNDHAESYVSLSLNFRKRLEKHYNILSRNFSPENLRNDAGTLRRILELGLAITDGQCDRLAFESYALDDSDTEIILDELGTPASWLPLIPRYRSLPKKLGRLNCGQIDLFDFISTHTVLTVSPNDLVLLKHNLRTLYEAGHRKGSGIVLKFPENNTEDGDTRPFGTNNPLPTETFIEELSVRLKVHPLSVYLLLEEGVDQENWRCLPEQQHIYVDRLTVVILLLLGHRWPGQIEAQEVIPEWVDPDGIIPITAGTNELTLLDRIRERRNQNFEDGGLKVELEFEDIMGKPLEEWILYDFFKHHLRQFKKRPVAWQIQSTPLEISKRGRGRKIEPAFSCLVYCQKVDGDILHKIRSQYVGPLKNGYEAELKTLETIGLLNTDQTVRQTKLEMLIDELKEFDDKLQGVINEGFDSKELEKLMRNEPLDKWCSIDGKEPPPDNHEGLYLQERAYVPDMNDGVRVNLVPLQKAGLLASDVLAKKDMDRAIFDRAKWRSDARRWCREEKLPQPGWWDKRKLDD